MISKRSFDCVVIGAGPAGSTTAALVAEHGFTTIVLERDEFPRPHVGESLMPESYWALDRLGIVKDMDRLGFVRKSGIQFVSKHDVEEVPLNFSEFDTGPSSVAWHVERSTFDKLLWDTAYNRGATVVDMTRVLDVDLRKQSPHKLTVSHEGKEIELTAKVIVDASGQQSLIANRLSLRNEAPEWRKSSIWNYFANGRRNGGTNCEVTCVLHTDTQEAWFWYIPLSNGTVSVGLVGDSDFILKRRETPEQTFRTEMNKCPGLKRRLQDATMVGKYSVAKDFSYTTKKQVGDGWVLVGDAAGFVDPIFCSGVFLALSSATMAADAIAGALAANDLTARRLGSWTADFESGVEHVRKLVRAFYTKPFSFGEFLNAFPNHRANFASLLAGKIFDGNAGKIFDDLEPWLDRLNKGESSFATATSD